MSSAFQAFSQFPKQIKYIVGNEAAERFSYYGMRSILTLFMIQELGMEKANATSIYHLFISAVYLLPLFGGFLSDRILGKYKTIIYLSIVYCMGHAALAIWEGTQGGLYTGLALIAIGSGGIKPCVSAHVGDQFKPESRHLIPKVYDIFYFSVNFGAFFSTLLIPWLRNHYGAGVAFGIPGILMGLATLVFWMGRNYYVHVPPTRETGAPGFLSIVWTAITNLSKRAPGEKWLDAAKVKFKADEIEGAKAVLDVIKVFVAVSVFWALFDQQGSTWTIQAERMNLNVLGMQLDASQIQAINPILVMILIPLVSGVIIPWLERKGWTVTPLRKMSTGMVFAALSFVLVGIFQIWIDQGAVVNVAWQFLPYFVITASEILVSITGLEFAYTQAPRSMKSTLMSFWLLTVFAGNFLAAFVTQLAAFFHVAGATEFFFYAGLMFLVSLVFIFMAVNYRMRNYIETQAEGIAT